MKSNFYTTVYLLLLISLGYIATDIYLPSLPALAVYFNVNDNDVQLTLFSYLLSFSLVPLISGPLSDHIGRKKVILVGLGIGLASTVGCLFSPTIFWMIVFRFLQGLGTGSVIIAARASVSDQFSGKKLAQQMSLMTMLMPLIFALAPSLGGILQETFQWQAVFIFLVCYMSAIIIFAAMKSESLKKVSQKKLSQVFSNYRTHLKNRPFLVYGINFILPALGMFAYMTTSPFLFQEVLGLSPLEYGFIAIYIGATIIGTGYINLKLINYFSVTSILLFGASLMFFAGGLLLFFHMMNIINTWSLLIPTLIFYTCLPFCISNAASKSLSYIQDHFGAASALLTCFQFLFGALASFIFSVISDTSALPLALCFMFVGLASLINLSFACRLENKVVVLNN